MYIPQIGMKFQGARICRKEKGQDVTNDTFDHHPDAERLEILEKKNRKRNKGRRDKKQSVYCRNSTYKKFLKRTKTRKDFDLNCYILSTVVSYAGYLLRESYLRSF